jgi:hypothetical protein
MMRKSLWIIPLLLLSAAVGVPAAHADTYQYTFTFTSSFFSGETTPIVFDTTGPISLGDYYAPISGSLGVDSGEDVTRFGIGVGVPGQDEIDYFIANGDSGGLNSGEVIPLITSGSESIPFAGVGTLGTLSVIDLTAVPEIDPHNSISALALLIGVVLVIRGRRSKTHESERVESTCFGIDA